MIETYLFIIVGAIAVVAAVMMLLSNNAVHSALFLILNFACVAFFYLMLDAPFLAMVQIAVYAGAIMVLFLFVIMLLGAEQAESIVSVQRGLPGSRPFTLAAAGLALVLLVVVGVAITGNTVDAIQPTGEPALRIVHSAASATLVDVEVDGVVVAEGVTYGESTSILALPAGEHEARITQRVTEEQEQDDGTFTEVETERVLFEGNITLVVPEAPNMVTTLVAYDTYPPGDATNAGDASVAVASFVQDFNPPTADRSRVVVFNGHDEPISLQDTGVFNREGDSRALLSGIETGAFSEPLILDEGRYRSLRFVRPADELADDGSGEPYFTIRDHTFEANTSVLVLVSALPGSAFPGVRYAETDTFATFGSPQAVGQMLFIDYVLPMQLVALVLLAALVGVIIIAQKQVAPDAARQSATRRPVRRRVSRSLSSVVTSQVSSTSSDSPRLGSGDEGAQPAGD